MRTQADDHDISTPFSLTQEIQRHCRAMIQTVCWYIKKEKSLIGPALLDAICQVEVIGELKKRLMPSELIQNAS